MMSKLKSEWAVQVAVSMARCTFIGLWGGVILLDFAHLFLEVKFSPKTSLIADCFNFLLISVVTLICLAAAYRYFLLRIPYVSVRYDEYELSFDALLPTGSFAFLVRRDTTAEILPRVRCWNGVPPRGLRHRLRKTIHERELIRMDALPEEKWRSYTPCCGAHFRFMEVSDDEAKPAQVYCSACRAVLYSYGDEGERSAKMKRFDGSILSAQLEALFPPAGENMLENGLQLLKLESEILALIEPMGYRGSH